MKGPGDAVMPYIMIIAVLTCTRSHSGCVVLGCDYILYLYIFWLFISCSL